MNRWKTGAALAALVLGLTACTQAISGTKTTNNLLPSVEPEYPAAAEADDYDKKMEVWEANQLDQKFLDGVERFSYLTASELLKNGTDNANYSPVSLYYGLALSQAGAKSDTEEEIGALLGGDDKEFLADQSARLYRLLYMDNGISKLKLGNSIWMDNNCLWSQEYENTAVRNFYASLHPVDFKEEETGKLMGSWVAEQTKGTLAPEMKTDPDQRLAILNTVYFNDQWVDQFDRKDTAADIFYLENGGTKQADFMNRTYASHGFSKGDHYTRSSLSLKENGSLILVLPAEDTDVDELLDSPEALKEALTGGSNVCGEVIFQIPKFSFDTEFKLADSLKQLGIRKAFTSDADFTGITEDAVFISDIIQQTHMSVNEDGVEASAFTNIEYAGAALATDKAEMRLNRPFLYALTGSNGVILFVGVVRNP